MAAWMPPSEQTDRRASPPSEQADWRASPPSEQADWRASPPSEQADWDMSQTAVWLAEPPPAPGPAQHLPSHYGMGQHGLPPQGTVYGGGYGTNPEAPRDATDSLTGHILSQGMPATINPTEKRSRTRRALIGLAAGLGMMLLLGAFVAVLVSSFLAE